MSIVQHKLESREKGLLRIYLTARIKGKKPQGWKKVFGGRPLYIELIAAAKADGILHAASHHAHHGFHGAQGVQSDFAETSNTNLTLYVELIDEKKKLEAFCRSHAEILRGRVLIYKHIEHWDIKDGETLKESEASIGELKVHIDEKQS